MGGGHHDFGPKMKIPDYRIFQVENAPELLTTKRLLAAKGLSNPWLRNDVWRYDRNIIPRRFTYTSFLTNGFGYGFAAFVVTIAFEFARDKLFAEKHNGGDEHH